jgi:hypothetical protein
VKVTALTDIIARAVSPLPHIFLKTVSRGVLSAEFRDPAIPPTSLTAIRRTGILETMPER